MSDTYRRYRAIKTALMQCFGPMKGHQMRHLNTLVALICGIIGARHVHLSRVADHAPAYGILQESLIMRLRRWLQNTNVTWETYMMPVARELLQALAHEPLVLVIDGTTVGRGCMALMISVVYGHRALPLAWVVQRRAKGHFPQAMHCALLAQVIPLIPPGATVYILGDGEFDGIEWLAAIEAQGWHYVCRTSPSLLMTAFDHQFPIGEVPLAPGQAWYCPDARFTAREYGPLMIIGCWEEGEKDPIYLLTNLASPEEAVALYEKRALIETLFSDQKERGFHLQASHLYVPERLERLLIATALAYIWSVYLGVHALTPPWRRRVHRGDRCDLSLFQLGMHLLAYCLKEGFPIPKGFLPSLPAPLTA